MARRFAFYDKPVVTLDVTAARAVGGRFCEWCGGACRVPDWVSSYTYSNNPEKQRLGIIRAHQGVTQLAEIEKVTQFHSTALGKKLRTMSRRITRKFKGSAK